MPANFGDFLTGGRAVRIARVAVERQRARLQRFFEFFVTERNGLVMIVGTYDIKVQAIAHESSYSLRFSANLDGTSDSS